jgi:hypothetical protein
MDFYINGHGFKYWIPKCEEDLYDLGSLSFILVIIKTLLDEIEIQIMNVVAARTVYVVRSSVANMLQAHSG